MRAKINSSYSYFAKIWFGVPQGSVREPVLFNAWICDHFYDIDDLDFASFADDNISYFCLSDMVAVFGQFTGGINKVFDWFTKSLIKGSANTCHLITIQKSHWKSRKNL